MHRIYIKQLRRFFTRQMNLDESVESLTDHRKKHEIPLFQIFYALLYTSILSKNNFLARDKMLRKNYMKNFLKSKRKMVASDSTLIRNLSFNIETNELKQVDHNIMNQLDPTYFIEPELKKRCCILDGTHVGGFMKEVLFIPGKTDFILNFNTIPKMGKELVSAEKLLCETNKILGKGYFDLILGDGLYYTKNMFRSGREKFGSNLLVKTTERLNVVKEAEEIINGFPDQIEEIKGYDCERSARFIVKVVKNVQGDTIDYPLQVAIIEETYIKENRKEIFYVITNDLNLTPEELRYCAHLRWRIENNGFKELNNLYQSKRKHSKNETCITNLLWIIFIAYNLFHLFLDSFDLEKLILKGKTVLKDWIDLLLESLIVDYSFNSS